MPTLFADDKSFFPTLWKLWSPLVLQQLIFSAINFVSTLMVGQLGETSMAAFSLAGQIIFLLQLFMFGVGSGAAIFVAQFWGRRDVANIRRILGVSLVIGLCGASVFTIIALIVPELALGIYSTDPAVIALGSGYMRVIGLGYIAVPITTSFTVALRSTGNVRVPVLISILAWGSSAFLNYALIFGHFGLPALGIQGSALGATIARWIECALLVEFAYATRSVAAAHLREMLAFDRAFLLSILKTMSPVIVNEIVWSIGISSYSLIYGRIGTEAVAAVSIAASVENLAFVPFIAVANAAAIMIGHRVGADEAHRAMDYAKRFVSMNIAVSIALGIGIFVSADMILRFYQVDAITVQYARQVLTVMACVLWIKSANMMLIVGVLRAGGDARVSALIDVGPLWLVGLPSAAIGAFVFGLPVQWVYLLTISDEACKMMLALWRMLSNQWIRNLARQHVTV